MLAGDNSILQKATDAKEYTERAEIVENAKIDVLNEITGNKGNDLQESQLKDVLKKYFVNSGIPEELPSDLSTLELTTLNNKYKIKVSEIYDGNLAKAKTSKKLTEIVKNTDYGKSVNYSVIVGEKTLNNWQVFLNDGSNVYIILGDYLDNDLVPNIGGVYTDGSDFIIYTEDGDASSLVDGLLTENYWDDFANGLDGAIATGSPTKEQLEESSGMELEDWSGQLSGSPYVVPKKTDTSWRGYFLASMNTDESYDCAHYVSSEGNFQLLSTSTGDGISIRPLVKLPADATGTVNSTVTIDK